MKVGKYGPGKKLLLLKGTLMKIWKSPYIVSVDVKTTPWKFRIPNLKNFRVTCPWSL